eukprot:1161376-Pelagomonas_calceolata.AAC.13
MPLPNASCKCQQAEPVLYSHLLGLLSKMHSHLQCRYLPPVDGAQQVMPMSLWAVSELCTWHQPGRASHLGRSSLPMGLWAVSEPCILHQGAVTWPIKPPPCILHQGAVTWPIKPPPCFLQRITTLPIKPAAQARQARLKSKCLNLHALL